MGSGSRGEGPGAVAAGAGLRPRPSPTTSISSSDSSASSTPGATFHFLAMRQRGMAVPASALAWPHQETDEQRKREKRERAAPRASGVRDRLRTLAVVTAGCGATGLYERGGWCARRGFDRPHKLYTANLERDTCFFKRRRVTPSLAAANSTVVLAARRDAYELHPHSCNLRGTHATLSRIHLPNFIHTNI